MGKEFADASDEPLVSVRLGISAGADGSEPHDFRKLAHRLEQRAAVRAQISDPADRAHRSRQADPAALAFEMRHPAAFVRVLDDDT
jgi:hypothetical protein